MFPEIITLTFDLSNPLLDLIGGFLLLLQQVLAHTFKLTLTLLELLLVLNCLSIGLLASIEKLDLLYFASSYLPFELFELLLGCIDLLLEQSSLFWTADHQGILDAIFSCLLLHLSNFQFDIRVEDLLSQIDDGRSHLFDFTLEIAVILSQLLLLELGNGAGLLRLVQFVFKRLQLI